MLVLMCSDQQYHPNTKDVGCHVAGAQRSKPPAGQGLSSPGTQVRQEFPTLGVGGHRCLGWGVVDGRGPEGLGEDGGGGGRGT